MKLQIGQTDTRFAGDLPHREFAIALVDHEVDGDAQNSFDSISTSLRGCRCVFCCSGIFYGDAIGVGVY
ncbi:hypothetical protein [Burkholderia sp. Ac-20345]|uniref:hypothetical protein n=1 Tax=Burkholderia sp. Ac-20345 TaxID=2703891 RepID=UPI001F11D2D9|nr:hypothetical protein [Burkholderia sp. Ac-20345]